jgi:hypothetical protein
MLSCSQSSACCIWYLELEVSVDGDGHELDITQMPHDDVVRPREIDHLECKRLGAVISHVSKADWQSDPPEGNILLSWDHSVERAWAALEFVVSEPQPTKGVEVHEVVATTPIHEGLG